MMLGYTYLFLNRMQAESRFGDRTQEIPKMLGKPFSNTQNVILNTQDVIHFTRWNTQYVILNTQNVIEIALKELL